jgi:YfiH family protein
MATWHWQVWQGLPYLTCSLLDPWLHGFFTQQFSPRSPTQLVEVFDPAVSAYRIRQVHGNTVLTPSEVEQFQQQTTAESGDAAEVVFPPADGLLTEQAGQAVWICSADCVPVLIADVETGQTAAVHAGWRGTAGAIVLKAIARLQVQGSKLPNLRVAMGPAIAGEVYQVSTTVAAEVGSTVVPEIVKSETASDPATILTALRELPESPLLSDPQPGRARLDVRRVNALQLQQSGIHPDQMAIAPYCTYQHAEHFFSYRRDQLKKVQWSGIVSRDV